MSFYSNLGIRMSYLCKSPRDGERTQDIGGNQIENTTPSSSSHSAGSILPLRIRDTHIIGSVIRGRHSLLIQSSLLVGRAMISRGIDRSSLALRETIHEGALEGPGAVGGSHSRVFSLFFGARDGRIVDIFFEADIGVMDCLEQLRLDGSGMSELCVVRVARIAALNCKRCVVHDATCLYCLRLARGIQYRVGFEKLEGVKNKTTSRPKERGKTGKYMSLNP